MSSVEKFFKDQSEMRSPGANEHEEFTADDALGQVWARRLSCDGVRIFEILNASFGQFECSSRFSLASQLWVSC